MIRDSVHALRQLEAWTTMVVGGESGSGYCRRLALAARADRPSTSRSPSTRRHRTADIDNAFDQAHGSPALIRQSSAMSPTPTVLHPLTLPGLLLHVLTTQSGTSSTLLIVCASQEVFLGHLAASLQQSRGEPETDELEGLLVPSLHNLFTTRHVRLAFCPSVQALLAYLTAYGQPAAGSMDEITGKERVLLVNPLALHAPTPSFSAQGLSRCFATAADMALKTGVQLQVVECEGSYGPCVAPAEEDVEMETAHETRHRTTIGDAWEQEVSILNVSARRFGSGSNERAWAGRTVKAKRIAARWFHFDELERRQTHSNHG
jgi:hypothetical protein